MAYYGIAYATIGSALRPFRFALAAAISPLFDRAIQGLTNKLRIKKWQVRRQRRGGLGVLGEGVGLVRGSE